MHTNGDNGPAILEAQVLAICEALGATSLSEAARLMGWPERTARNWVNRGRIPVARLLEIARRTRVPIERLEGRPNNAARAMPAAAHAAGGMEDNELLRLSDSAWPALVVRNAIVAVRGAEEDAQVALAPSLLADAVTIVVTTGALAHAAAETIAQSVIATYIQTKQVKRRAK